MPTNIVVIRESGLAIIVLELELELSHQCVVKNSQNTVKTAKMTIGVPLIVTSTQSPLNTQSPHPPQNPTDYRMPLNFLIVALLIL